jgi:hypothetical protein
MTLLRGSSTFQSSPKGKDDPLPQKSTFPVRKAVLTYLHHLDRQWRGGWSWQWPLVIAGPKKGGKTLLLYQFIASALLSYPSPWRIAYCDCRGNYCPEQILRVLQCRSPSHSRHNPFGRIDKTTIFRGEDFITLSRLQLASPYIALWTIDAVEQIISFKQVSHFLQQFAKINRFKQIGIILTIRGTIEELRPLIPWNDIPFFLFINQLKHGFFRLRVWQNGAQNLIYDRKLLLKGYFREAKYRSLKKHGVP